MERSMSLAGKNTSRRKISSSPSKNDKAGPFMGVDDPPHERLKLEDNVRDVENGQKPFVAIARKIEVFLHACDFRIADIRPVEEGEQDYKTGAGQLLVFATVTQVRCVQSPDTNGGTCRS